MPLIDFEIYSAEFAKRYSELNISGTAFLGFRDIPDLIEKHVHGITTLDHGCGAGRSSTFLKSLGLDVEGVDINPEMVNIARRKDPTGKYNLIQNSIPVNDNHYDCVFSSWVFVHVESKVKLLKVLQEISRVLKMDGTLIAVNGNENFYDYTDLLTFNSQFEENKNLVSGSKVKLCFKTNDLTIIDYYWSDADYRELMEEAGLTIVETHFPLGKDSDGFDWGLERTKSPFTIFIAKKRGGDVRSQK